jgi:hypothetical protein
MSEDWPARTTDPDGREVVFDGGSHLHLFDRKRSDLLDQVDVILGQLPNQTSARRIQCRDASGSTAKTARPSEAGSAWP